MIGNLFGSSQGPTEEQMDRSTLATGGNGYAQNVGTVRSASNAAQQKHFGPEPWRIKTPDQRAYPTGSLPGPTSAKLSCGRPQPHGGWDKLPDS
ncbi:hypothetical protein CBOM_01648 [Ceraceosorus bombacis]|uniref:Uncharacterized protein n=1 Tax=Ceraceosorus bombacis TaxID=401625 RepID=A0A0N7L9G8_9BASI|nr:hypothetical protein CBOM_01648 [Ceraceosorus bombacis]